MSILGATREVLPIPPGPGALFHRAVGSLSQVARGRWSAFRRRPSVTISALLVLAVLAGGIGYAIGSDDYPVADVQLHDNGIWVTSQQDMKVARFNTEARDLETGVPVTSVSESFDVLQDDAAVLVYDAAGGSMFVVDPATGTLGPRTVLPSGTVADLRGQTLAVAQSSSGKVWVRPAAGVAGVNLPAQPVTLTAGQGAAVAVGVDGTAMVASPAKGEILSVPRGSAAASSLTLKGFRGAVSAQITAVGDQPVVLDTATGRLWTSDGPPRDLSSYGQHPVLQRAGPAAAAVLVATDDNLLSVALGTGKVTPIGTGSGSPAAPVWLSGCAYGAWSGGPTHVTYCGGPLTQPQRVKESQAGDGLTFRVNRGRVVLNNLKTGAVIAPKENQAVVADFLAINQAAKTQSEKQKYDNSTSQQDLGKKSSAKTKPVARPDDYGTRPDRSVLVRALENDSDDDGDILAIVGVSNIVDGTAAIVEDGQAIQVTPKPGVAKVTLKYEITDPSGNPADADVTVDVRDDAHAAPVLRIPKMAAKVVSGKRVDYDVLAAWRDQWNDPMFVKSVQAPSGSTVQLTPQGVLTYLDQGSSPGVVSQIPVVVSDGTDSTEKMLDLTVLPDKAQPPVARNDVVTGVAGRPISVFPLRNDTDLTGEALHLGGKPTSKNLTVDLDPSQTRLDITAPDPGTYLVRYVAANDAQRADGVVRVDVAPDAGNEKPVAVDDEAFISRSGTGDADLLANDVDPNGDVLVVQSVEQPADPSIRVAVLEHRLLQVWSKKPIEKVIPLRYTVSDGENASTATVLIRSVADDSANQRPVAADDTVAVRAGDVVDVPVTVNDSDPDGGSLTVDPSLTLGGVSGGVATVQGNVVRLQAPVTPGTMTVIYTVQDSGGDRASAQIVVTVRPQDADPDHDQAPVPQEIIGRTLARSSVEIPVPLSGIDPDGDSVFVAGAESPPKLGRVSPSSDGKSLLYEAFNDSAGTDVFSYRVVDAHGASGSATIRVGVAPNTAGNTDPIAVDDAITIRPGRAVTVPVLDNDVDSDGDTLSIAPDRPLTVTGNGTAVVRNNAIDVTAASAGPMVIGYSAADGGGGYGAGYLVVTAAADAPLLAPIARDDVTQAGAGKTVMVPVLANDRDPDGRAADLKVTLAGAHADAGSVGAGGQVTVKRAPAAITVAYTVTDLDDQVSTAFIWVPGTSNQPPRLKSGVDPLVVKPGASATLRLADWVMDPEGAAVTLADGGGVTAVHGKASASGTDAVTFTADQKAAGPADVSFLVVDQSGPTGRAMTALITVPIQIVSPASKPEFRATSISVVRGQKPVTLDLRRFVSDPGAPPGSSYTFTANPAPSGLLGVKVSGSQLTVEASSVKGGSATGSIAVTVRRSGGGAAVSGTIKVRVGVATQSLPAPHDYTVTGAPGMTVSLPWQANVTVAPGSSASLARRTASVIPSGAGSATISGSSLTFTPAKDFAGSVTVSYAVTDTPGDSRRQVPARAFVVIQGKPGVPGTPSLVSQADASVTLAWSPAASNGAVITHYVVTDGAQLSRKCEQTTCPITGLTNGKEYRFKVQAVNAVGSGTFSQSSAPVTPDSRPDTPSAPLVSLVPGGAGGKLAVTWPPVSAPGGGLVTYEVQASPAVAPITTTAPSVTFDGLTNGTAYTFKVRAKTTGQFTDFGPSSLPQTPIGVPDAPGQPQVVQTTPTSAEVNWTTPAGNGGTITGYVLRVSRGGSNTDFDVAGAQTTKTLDLVASENYEFSVQAQNQAGASAFSLPTTFTPQPPPGLVTGLSVKEQDQQVTLSFNAPTTGMAVKEYRYSQNGGAFKTLPDTKVVDGLTNGTSYTFRVEACSTACGDPTDDSTSVIPFGQPPAPTVRLFKTSANDDVPKILANATCPAAESNGRQIDHLESKWGNGDWVSSPATCNATIPTYLFKDYGSISFSLRAVDSKGTQGKIHEETVVGNPNEPTYSFAYKSACTPNTAGNVCNVYTLSIAGLVYHGVGDVVPQCGGSSACSQSTVIDPTAEGFRKEWWNPTYSVSVESASDITVTGFSVTNLWVSRVIAQS